MVYEQDGFVKVDALALKEHCQSTIDLIYKLRLKALLREAERDCASHNRWCRWLGWLIPMKPLVLQDYYASLIPFLNNPKGNRRIDTISGYCRWAPVIDLHENQDHCAKMYLEACRATIDGTVSIAIFDLNVLGYPSPSKTEKGTTYL